MEKQVWLTDKELYALSTIIDDFFLWNREEDKDLHEDARSALDKILGAYLCH